MTNNFSVYFAKQYKNNLYSWTTGSLIHTLKIYVSFKNELKWPASWALLSPVAVLYLMLYRVPCFSCLSWRLCRRVFWSLTGQWFLEGRDNISVSDIPHQSLAEYFAFLNVLVKLIELTWKESVCHLGFSKDMIICLSS